VSNGAAEDARERLVRSVQANCDIADARHAADLTLCTYLLQMREFFRWERGLPFGAALARAEVGAWIAEREALWQRCEAAAFEPLRVPGAAQALDPFDVDAVNERLAPLGLLYGAGLVDDSRPVFFLALRHAVGQREGLRVHQAGRELARGLAAPPAALAGADDGPVVLRREALARVGWERYEAFALRPQPGSAFAAVVKAYGFDAGFDTALPRWLDEHSEVALLHELGEHRIGRLLGARWPALRQALPSRRARLAATALRDQLADLGTTLPTLLERGADASLHAWFAAYDGVREALFPDFPLAYRAWRDGDGGRSLRHAIEHGRSHFTALAQRALDLHDRHAPVAAIEQVLAGDAAVCRFDPPLTARRAST
jgi:hypothetical protein